MTDHKDRLPTTGATATYKSNDTEEWLDKVFTRPIGYCWAKFFEYFGVHPNVVTVLSMILGFASAFFFVYKADTTHGFWMNVIGVLLLMWANFYDSADGQLARMTGKKTQLGRILDGAAGDIWFTSVYVAIALRLQREYIPYTEVHWGIWSWVMVVFCGVCCHAPQGRLSDYYRNIHLFFLKGKQGSEFDNSAAESAKYNAMPWKGNLLPKLFQWIYKDYCRQQEKATPHFQAFWSAVRTTYGSDVPQSLRDAFRVRSLPLMKYTNILTFNCRAIVLYVSCLVDRPWIYPMFEIIVLSALYFYMHYRHERFCKTLLCELESAK